MREEKRNPARDFVLEKSLLLVRHLFGITVVPHRPNWQCAHRRERHPHRRGGRLGAARLPVALDWARIRTIGRVRTASMTTDIEPRRLKAWSV